MLENEQNSKKLAEANGGAFICNPLLSCRINFRV